MQNNLLAITATLLLLPALSRAQATRTWISGVGADANPGSRTAPCKTFAGAISKTAVNGVIDVLDPGGFGAVTITKGITLEGDGAEGDILVSGTHGIVIAAGTNDVIILRNLTFEGLESGLSGISIQSAGSVHIENCRINGFLTSGINFINNITNAQFFVKDTTIHNCTPAGINLAPTAPATVLIERVNVTDSSNGIEAAGNIKSVLVDATASGNAGVGFLVGTNAQMTVKRGTSSDNDIGIQCSGVLVLSDSTVANNASDGLKIVKPGKIITGRDNVVFGNTPDGKANAGLPVK